MASHNFIRFAIRVIVKFPIRFIRQNKQKLPRIVMRLSVRSSCQKLLANFLALYIPEFKNQFIHTQSGFFSLFACLFCTHASKEF